MRTTPILIPGLTTFAILCACSVAHAEVKTVSWFLTHPDTLAKVHRLCMNNPGEAKHVPDCLNAATALEQSDTRGMMARIPVKSLAQICAEMPAYQRPINNCGGSR